MYSFLHQVKDGCISRGKVGMLFCGDKARAKAALEDGWSAVFPGADISWMVAAAADMGNTIDQDRQMPNYF